MVHINNWAVQDYVLHISALHLLYAFILSRQMHAEAYDGLIPQEHCSMPKQFISGPHSRKVEE
jgi:hypothetical protein